MPSYDTPCNLTTNMRLKHYIGVPGAGKTTMMRKKLEELRSVEPEEFVKEGFVTYHKFPKQKTIVLGCYDERTFSGLDTWSKAAPPKFRQWLLDNAAKYDGWSVLSEGERLSNAPSLDAMFATGNMELFLLDTPSEELERRRQSRNNTQNETWLKGMETRIKNLCAKYPHTVIVNE